MSKLDISELNSGCGKGITPCFGGGCAEACCVCFEEVGHASGVTLSVLGPSPLQYEVHWEPATEQARNCWNDLEVAAEHGAYGLAFLLVRELTEYEVIRRSRKGTGFDYWLGQKDNPMFQESARLEVSGILRGDKNTREARVRQKLEQIKRSESLKLKAHVIVVEFGTPEGRMVVR